MTRECILYLAGLIEGEGYLKSYEYERIRFTKKGLKSSTINRGIAISVAMTDKDVIQKYGSMLGELFNFDVKMRGPLKNGKSLKPLYEIRVYADKAYAIMAAIYPFMGKRRKKDIEKAINVYKQISVRKSKLDYKSLDI